MDETIIIVDLLTLLEHSNVFSVISLDVGSCDFMILAHRLLETLVVTAVTDASEMLSGSGILISSVSRMAGSSSHIKYDVIMHSTTVYIILDYYECCETINRMQNKVCVYIICVCTVYIYYKYKHIQYIFKKNMLCLYTYIHARVCFIYIIHNIIHILHNT